MSATFHLSSFSRYFAKICRIRHEKLRVLAHPSGRKLLPKALPATGAVYCFWWTGEHALLMADNCNRELCFKGPSGRRISICMDDAWLGLDSTEAIPLYVGKTGDLNARMRQHLYLGKARAIPAHHDGHKIKAPTTSCQVRAGIDYLFPRLEDSRDILLDNVGISWVALHGDTHVVNRFYLENFAIGQLHPPFNMDVER